MTTYNLSVYRGTTISLRVTAKIKQDIGVIPLDLSSAGIVFKVFASKTQHQTIFQKKNTLAGGNNTQINVTDAVNGKFDVHLSDSDTLLFVNGIYHPYSIVVVVAANTYVPVRGLIFGIGV